MHKDCWQFTIQVLLLVYYFSMFVYGSEFQKRGLQECKEALESDKTSSSTTTPIIIKDKYSVFMVLIWHRLDG